MKVIFVNRFYWPETPATGQLLTDLAEGLVGLGWEVTVITSAASADVPSRELHRGVQILRVAGTRWSESGTLGKAVDFATFYLGALWRVLRTARQGTTVVSMTDPPMLGIGVWLVARCRRARVVHWIQDIYPEIAIELSGHCWLHLLRPLRDIAWRAAGACVTIGFDMAKALTRAGVRTENVSVVPNWGPTGVTPLGREAANTLRHEWGLMGKFVVAYSGNLGRVHDLDAVLELAEDLRSDPDIHVVIVGDGAQRHALESAARQRGLPNLAFHPPQPRHLLREALAVGDIHLVTLRPGCEGFVFPSKLYGIAAAGRPILFIGPVECEVARCVIAQGIGRVAARADVAGLAAAVRELATNPATYADHVTAAVHFAAKDSASVAITRWHGLLSAIAGSPLPAPHV